MFFTLCALSPTIIIVCLSLSELTIWSLVYILRRAAKRAVKRILYRLTDLPLKIFNFSCF